MSQYNTSIKCRKCNGNIIRADHWDQKSPPHLCLFENSSKHLSSIAKRVCAYSALTYAKMRIKPLNNIQTVENIQHRWSCWVKYNILIVYVYRALICNLSWLDKVLSIYAKKKMRKVNCNGYFTFHFAIDILSRRTSN